MGGWTVWLLGFSAPALGESCATHFELWASRRLCPMQIHTLRLYGTTTGTQSLVQWWAMRLSCYGRRHVESTSMDGCCLGPMLRSSSGGAGTGDC